MEKRLKTPVLGSVMMYLPPGFAREKCSSVLNGREEIPTSQNGQVLVDGIVQSFGQNDIFVPSEFRSYNNKK